MGDANDSLNQILERVAREQQYEETEISIKSISSGGANYTSYLYLVTLSAKGKDDLKLFVKVAAAGEKFRSIAPLRLFEVESFFYNKLRKIYEDIEEKHMVPAEHRFVNPKFYASNDECYKEALVLEDMTSIGYQAFDRFKSIDWNYAFKSIRNLATFHALSIAWSVEDPDEFKKTEGLQFESNMDFMEDYIKKVINNVVGVTKPENKERLQKFLEVLNGENEFTKYYKPIRRPVVAHGDYRPSNLLHRIHDMILDELHHSPSYRVVSGQPKVRVVQNGEVDVISVDYQTLQISNPIVDLMYFIYTGSDKTFRKNHLKQTIEHYYVELCAALRRLHLNPDDMYPREDYDFEMEQMLPFGLVISMFCLLIVTVQEEDAPKVNENIEINDFAVTPSELYTERINDIIDDYIDMGII